MTDTIRILIERWKTDPAGAYQTWFLWPERLKNFRSIFIHPTLMMPFNTAIVNGYNALTGSSVKLGKWDHYLAMREGVLALNQRYRDLLSNDLGAIAGLLFDIGMQRYPLPPRQAQADDVAVWQQELAKVREQAAALARQIQLGQAEDATHTEVQGWLRDLGKSLGFAVWIATNDRSRLYNGEPLSQGCLSTLPPALLVAGGDTVPLIDTVWLNATTLEVEAAFEVEHTTSIYSGIVRLLDLALGSDQSARKHLFLVAPDDREGDVRAQLSRPAFSRVSALNIRYVPYSSLREHRESIACFGSGLKPIEAIARQL